MVVANNLRNILLKVNSMQIKLTGGLALTTKLGKNIPFQLTSDFPLLSTILELDIDNL